MSLKSIGLTEPKRLGAVLALPDGKYRIVRQMPRDEWWAQILAARHMDKVMGLPKAKAGFLNIDTEGNQPTEYIPNWNEPGPEFKFCYVVERVSEAGA